MYELSFAKRARCKFKVFRRAEKSGKLTYSRYILRFLLVRGFCRVYASLRARTFGHLREVSFPLVYDLFIHFPLFEKSSGGVTDKLLVCNVPIKTDPFEILKVTFYFSQNFKKRAFWIDKCIYVPYYLFIIFAINHITIIHD